MQRRCDPMQDWMLIAIFVLWPCATAGYLWHPEPVGFIGQVGTGVYIALWLWERHRARKGG